MPRGGTGKPDDFSPYKSPKSGRVFKLLKSARSSNGYQNIKVPHPGSKKPFAAYYQPVAGCKKQKQVPGSSSATAREAAIHLAKHLADYEKPHVGGAVPSIHAPTALAYPLALPVGRKKTSRLSPSSSRTRRASVSRSPRSCALPRRASAAMWPGGRARCRPPSPCCGRRRSTSSRST